MWVFNESKSVFNSTTEEIISSYPFSPYVYSSKCANHIIK